MGRWDNWGYYEPARPKPVKDGIRAKSQRGEIGETWWSKRWIGVLHSFGMGARLDRGRSYARKGQVVSIDVQKGIVTAKVQGTRAKPYSVEIELKPLSEKAWETCLSWRRNSRPACRALVANGSACRCLTQRAVKSRTK